MLKNYGLYDPIERTHEMKLEEFTKYTEIRDAQLVTHEPTDPALVETIRADLYASHPEVPKEKLDEMWSFIGKKINQNEGLAQFSLDYGGAKSDYFFPWLKAVFTSPAEALDLSYGMGRNLSGEWGRVPKTDPMYSFVPDDPTFVYNRERQLFVADLVTTVQKKAAAEEEVSKVADFGAGWMAWARWHGFKFDPKWQQILANDMDPTIVPEKLFDRKLSDLGLTFTQADLRMQVAKPEYRDLDAAILGGVATYYPLEGFMEAVIKPVYALLKANGIFFFDLQVSCPYLLRSMKIFDWPPMQLKKDATTTIEAVEKVRSTLWKAGMRFSAEYALDTYNEFPTAVMITLTKL